MFLDWHFEVITMICTRLLRSTRESVQSIFSGKNLYILGLRLKGALHTNVLLPEITDEIEPSCEVAEKCESVNEF